MRPQAGRSSTRIHAQPSPTKEFNYAPFSRQTSSTNEIHYAPLSSVIACSPFKTSDSHSRTSSLSHTSTSLPIESSPTLGSSSVSTGLQDPIIQISSLAPTCTNSSHLTGADFHDNTSGPSIELTVTISILLGIMMAFAIMLWFAETRNQEQTPKLRNNEKASHVEQAEAKQGPVGLGITFQREAGDTSEPQENKFAISWIERAFAKVVDFAISKSLTEIGISAENGLLLPVRDEERTSGERSQGSWIDID